MYRTVRAKKGGHERRRRSAQCTPLTKVLARTDAKNRKGKLSVRVRQPASVLHRKVESAHRAVKVPSVNDKTTNHNNTMVSLGRGARVIKHAKDFRVGWAISLADYVLQKENRDANFMNNDPILLGLKSGRCWGDVIFQADAIEERRLIHMSREAFEAEKQTSKNNKTFANWAAWLEWAQRLEKLRAAARIPKPMPVVKVKTYLDNLLGLRRDYISDPQMHFSDRKEQTGALYKLEAEIRKEGGSMRLDQILDMERKEAAPEIRAVIERVKSQAAALRKCKQTLAAYKITECFRKVRDDRQDLREIQEYEEEMSAIFEVFMGKGKSCYCHSY